MKINYSSSHKTAAAFFLLSFVCFSCAYTPGEGRSAALSATTENASIIEPGQKMPASMPSPVSNPSGKKIQIALLLDVSGSMDGLIDQAKSQLWKLVNELSLASNNNIKPQLEIALYEYGSATTPVNEGYLRKLSDFTGDLDLVSEKLFELRTSGSEEYCGQVIQSSADQLEWTGSADDFRVIFIAGNEEFTQGSVNYKTSCANAKEKDIVVNTIFCGDFLEGINTGWKNGALLADGEYMNIDQNKKTVYIETPYDAEIAKLNDKFNATYISYGSRGYEKQKNQLAQDANASTFGASNMTTRTISKTTSFYSNGSWDLVDASREKEFDIKKIKEDDLPKELKGKTAEEKQKYIDEKNKEREEIKKQIAALNKKRIAYIAEKEKELNPDTKSLDAAMLKAIRAQAAKKNFVFAAN